MIPTLETKRLILRPLGIDDAQAAFEWTGDERVAHYMIYPTHTDIGVTKAWLESLSDKDEKDFNWGFVRRADGVLIGAGNIRFRYDENRWSFGYNIRFDCWNQGYTTEAALRMMDFVRQTYGAKRFVAECAAENIGSAKVIEKCGLCFDGYCEYSKSDGSVTFKAKRFVLNEE